MTRFSKPRAVLKPGLAIGTEDYTRFLLILFTGEHDDHEDFSGTIRVLQEHFPHISALTTIHHFQKHGLTKDRDHPRPEMIPWT